MGNIYLPGNIISIANKQSKVPELALPMDPSKIKNNFLIFGHKVSELFKLLNPVFIIASLGIIIAAVISNPSQFNQVVAIIFGLYLVGKVFIIKNDVKENA